MWPAILAGASILGKILGGNAQGSAAERQNRNQFGQDQDRTAASLYGTQQNALLQALLARGRDTMDAYQTRQGATTSALGNQSQEATGRYGIQQGATTSALANQSQENIQRAELGLRAPTARARQSVMGSLMANMQPVTVEGGNPRLAGRVPKISGGLTPAALGADTRQHGAELSKAALMAQLTGSDVPAATDFRSGILQAPSATDFKAGILDAPESIDYSKGLMAPPQLQGYQRPGRGESVMSFLSMLLSGVGDTGSAAMNARAPQFGIGARNTGLWSDSPGPPPGTRG